MPDKQAGMGQECQLLSSNSKTSLLPDKPAAGVTMWLKTKPTPTAHFGKTRPEANAANAWLTICKRG